MKFIRMVLPVLLIVCGSSFAQKLVYKNGIVQQTDILVEALKASEKGKKQIIIPTQLSSKKNLRFPYYNSIGIQSSQGSMTSRSPYGTGISDNDMVSANLTVGAPKPESYLGGNINTSNDLYTGTKNISIPIHSFTSKEISVPISVGRRIPYSRKGMKESNLGFGWSLQTGGEITRSVHGKADEGANGYFVSYTKIENAHSLSDADFDAGLRNEWDTAPDEFHFNVNGIQGSFMFDKDKKVHVNSNSAVKVLPSWGVNEILGFTIIDDLGFEYYFGGSDNTIEKVASKTTTGITNYIPAGLYSEYNPVENRFYVYNYIPHGSVTVVHPITGATSFVTVNDIINPITGTNDIYNPVALKTYQDVIPAPSAQLSKTPVNVSWKLVRIESPNKTDVVTFEYDSGGWSEYAGATETSTFKYRLEDGAQKRLLVRNPFYCPSPCVGESQYIRVTFPGKYYRGRPESWYVNGFDPYQQFTEGRNTPLFYNDYFPTVYKKSSSLTKITNQYGEYIQFNYEGNVNGYDVLTTGNYGTSYIPKYLNNIKKYTPLSGETRELSSFEITNHDPGYTVGLLTKITSFDNIYAMNYNGVGIETVNTITQPTGGFIKFIGNTKEEIHSIENGITIKENVYNSQDSYGAPNHEVKKGISDDNGVGLIDMYTTSKVYNEMYTRGMNEYKSDVYQKVNGKLVSKTIFTNPKTHPDDANTGYIKGSTTTVINSNYHEAPPNMRDFERGAVAFSIEYQPQADVSKVTSHQENSYETVSSIKAVRLNNYYAGPGEIIGETSRTYSHYNYYFYRMKNAKEQSKINFKDGKISTESTYSEFDSKNNLIKSVQTDSKENEIITKYKYPYTFLESFTGDYNSITDVLGKDYYLMNYENILKTPIEQSVYKKENGSNTEKLMFSRVNQYKHLVITNNAGTNHGIFPKSVETMEENELIDDYMPLRLKNNSGTYTTEKDSRLKEKSEYVRFDTNGNFLESKNTDDIPTSYIWGYNNRFVAAQVTGMTYAQIESLIGASTLSSVNQSTDANYLIEKIQQIRDTCNDCQVTNYTYENIHNKVNAIIDLNGVATYYEYDYAGRLSVVKDDTGAVLKEYRYNLKVKN